MCQHSHKHEPTPTSVKINDVKALITISVLLAVASFDVTTIGGFGQFPPSSIQYGGGQLLMPSRSNFFDIHVLSKHRIKFGGPQSENHKRNEITTTNIRKINYHEIWAFV